MDQSCEVGTDGDTVSNDAQLAKSFIVSAERLTLPNTDEHCPQLEADQIERRLQRIEEALELGITYAH